MLMKIDTQTHNTTTIRHRHTDIGIRTSMHTPSFDTQIQIHIGKHGKSCRFFFEAWRLMFEKGTTHAHRIEKERKAAQYLFVKSLDEVLALGVRSLLVIVFGENASPAGTEMILDGCFADMVLMLMMVVLVARARGGSFRAVRGSPASPGHGEVLLLHARGRRRVRRRRVRREVVRLHRGFGQGLRRGIGCNTPALPT